MRLLTPTLLLLILLPSLNAAEPSPKDLINTMVARENEAELHRGRYLYTSKERSERTGNHLWTERVAETAAGKVRFLVAEDNQPLPPDRAAAERSRLADILAHPDDFAKRELALKNDEQHAKQILELLPKAFLFDPPQPDGAFLRIAFKPNPGYTPASLEERVLHSMNGSLMVDRDAMRLHKIEGRLPSDVNIGFGLIATIHAGRNFSTLRDRVSGNEYKTAVLDTDINGRAIFFKAIGKKEHAEHTDFKKMPDSTSLPEAVTLVQQPTP